MVTMKRRTVSQQTAGKIRYKYAKGNYTIARLASQHRLSEGTISRIINNKMCVDSEYVRPRKTAELVAQAVNSGATMDEIAEQLPRQITPQAVRYHLPPDCIFRVERKPQADGRLSQMAVVAQREIDSGKTVEDACQAVAERWFNGDRNPATGKPFNTAGVAHLANSIMGALGSEGKPLTQLDQMNRMVRREVEKGSPLDVATEQVARQFAGKQGIRASSDEMSNGTRTEIELLAQRLRQLQLEGEPC